MRFSRNVRPFCERAFLWRTMCLATVACDIEHRVSTALRECVERLSGEANSLEPLIPGNGPLGQVAKGSRNQTILCGFGTPGF
jgi:hypothetical protein